MSESEQVLRQLAAVRCTQPRQVRDPLARAIAKAIIVAFGLLLGAALILLRDGINWQFIGR